MFISNCDYTKEIGRLPTAKVTLVGVSDKDIEGIADDIPDSVVINDNQPEFISIVLPHLREEDRK